jgi:hypothetical protein
MNMKRIGLLATGIAVLISIRLLTVERAYAENDRAAPTMVQSASPPTMVQSASPPGSQATYPPDIVRYGEPVTASQKSKSELLEKSYGQDNDENAPMRTNKLRLFFTLPPSVTQYYWEQGEGPVNMIPDNQGICGLVAVRGAYRGGGESVQVQDVNGVWQLSGASQQQGVFAEARCVQFSAFNYSTINYSLGDWWAWATASDTKTYFKFPMLGQHAFCWVNGFGGFWNYPNKGWQDFVGIWDDPINAGAPKTLVVYGYAPWQLMFGAAACVDFPNASKVNVVGWADWNPDSDVEVPTGVDIVPGWGNRGNSGICFLQSVGGDFASRWDSIGIGIDGHGRQYLLGFGLNCGPGNGQSPVGSVAGLSYNQGG